MRQSELRELLPGSAGGRRLVEQRGAEYMRQLGAAGGRRTVENQGAAYMRGLATTAAQARWWRPRTLRQWDGVTVRRVAYWTSDRRRRRPLLVRIEQ
jgi:hypothetical protein